MLSFLKPTVSFLKKVFLVVAVYFIVISLFSFFINKDKANLQTKVDPIEKNRVEIYKIINDKKLNSSQEGKLTIALYKATMCGMIGEACTNNPKDGDKNFEKSVFGFITKLIVMPYANPPASGVYWVYSGLQSAGFLPKTLAAEGIGFAAIHPFADLWKIFRDVSYMVLVLVLITIGFMVMFRMKINPQTVISVENALPKIIVAMILITFSFAIAGFMIDLMYIMIGLIVSVLVKDSTLAAQMKNQYMMGTPSQLWLRDLRLGLPFPTESIAGEIGKSLLGILPIEVEIVIRSAIGILMIFITRGFIGNTIVNPIADLFQGLGTSPGFTIGGLISGIVKLLLNAFLLYGVYALSFYTLITPIFSFIIFFSMLFLLFRIVLLLFSNYLKLLLLIILGPFLLLFEAIPGKGTLKFWLMSMMGNLLAFPLTIGVFTLSYVIMQNIPDTELTARLPYLYGISSSSFKILVSTGLIFLIPDLYKWLKESLGIKDLPISIGLGTFFGGVTTGVGGAVGMLGQFGSISLGLQALTGKSINQLIGDGGKGIAEGLKKLKQPAGSGGNQPVQ